MTPSDAPVDTAPLPDACVPSTSAPLVIYLNRMGGTYSPGADDAGANTTAILSSAKTLPATTVVAGEWTAFVTCLTAKLAPFQITVTETDPGTAQHMELVVIDNAQAIGEASGLFGIAPSSCDGTAGHVYANGIAFVMWNVGAADRCQTGAQMIGNLFGLDHAYSCPDVMTYLNTCGPSDNKTFTKADVRCGELSERNCQCGPATQNSFRTLATKAGVTCH